MITIGRGGRYTAMRVALYVGFGFGTIYTVLLSPALTPVQGWLEPSFVWVEVAIGVAISLIAAVAGADSLDPDAETSWRYASRLWLWLCVAAFVGTGAPLVLHELVWHIVLGNA